MPLKPQFASVTEIPAELCGAYVEREGAFVLDYEPPPPLEDKRVAEFRTHNIALQKQVTDYHQRFDGIDPEHRAPVGCGRASPEKNRACLPAGRLAPPSPRHVG